MPRARNHKKLHNYSVSELILSRNALENIIRRSWKRKWGDDVRMVVIEFLKIIWK